ncbi:MAG: hypothetical protein P8Y53_22825 [Pseudolabrys sp.]
MALNKLAVCRVNGCVRHLAVRGQQRQQVDEAVTAAAEPGPQHFGLLLAVPKDRFDGAAERNGAMAGDRRPLLGLAQAGVMSGLGVMRPLGGIGPLDPSGQAGQKADQKQGCKAGEYGHEAGDNGAPVNTA